MLVGYRGDVQLPRLMGALPLVLVNFATQAFPQPSRQAWEALGRDSHGGDLGQVGPRYHASGMLCSKAAQSRRPVALGLAKRGMLAQ